MMANLEMAGGGRLVRLCIVKWAHSIEWLNEKDRNSRKGCNDGVPGYIRLCISRGRY